MSTSSASARRSAGTTSVRRGSRPALAAALLGFFVMTLDALVVNVALPAIGRGFGGGMTGLQWVVDGYTLMFAALLLSSGAVSDRIGARRAFGVGLGVFVAASAACGLAPDRPAAAASPATDSLTRTRKPSPPWPSAGTPRRPNTEDIRPTAASGSPTSPSCETADGCWPACI